MRRQRTLCGIRIKSFETLFVSAPLCRDSDLCDSDLHQSAVVGCFECTPLCDDNDAFIEALKKDANTIVIFIPGGLTPLVQPLDRMLNKQMKRRLRGMYTKYIASAPSDSKTGKLTPPGRGVVFTWCKDAWASITLEMVKTCIKICGVTLALDSSEDHAWCMHNSWEGYRELLEKQRVEWLAEHPGVPLPPLQLPEVPAASSTNHIEAAAQELEAKLLPRGDDSDVEIVDGAGGEAEGEVVEL